MQKTINEMLDKKVWAVVGATQNSSKFGNKIVKKLKEFGYEVYPVNPVYDEVEGLKCYKSLSDLPLKPDCVSVVVSPDKANLFVDEAKSLEIEYMWFQPGAFSEKTIAIAEEHELKIVYHNCVLVELDKRIDL